MSAGRGGGAALVDERSRPTLRARLGAALAGARHADFAVARIRLAGLDLGPAELAGVRRCRLLLGRFDAATLLDAVEDARDDSERRRHLRTLRDFAATGRIRIRCAGIDAWHPDFSVFDATPPLAFVGAHYFWRPAPVGGPAWTCVLRDADAVARLAARFDALWERGYDVLDIVREALAILAPSSDARRNTRGAPDPAPRPLRVREAPCRAEAGIAWRIVTPAEAARHILRARLGPGTPAAGGRRVFELADFQRDAVRRAEAILAVRRGVVIADSVGLGKTFIALALVEAALKRGERATIIAPAALRRQWLDPLRRLARRLGIHAMPRQPSDTAWPDTPIAFASHARLSRGLPDPPPALAPALVVVDEAHAFRTPTTRRYHALARLCRDTRVVLLTATPVNNSPLDLYTLLRLFSADGDFRDVGVADTGAAFRDAAGQAGGALPAELMPVVRAIMVRRTRPFIREHYRGVRLPDAEAASGGEADGQVLTFPHRAPPVALRHELAAAAPELPAVLDRSLSGLTGVAAIAARMARSARRRGTRAPELAAVERAARAAQAASDAASTGPTHAAPEAALLRFTLLKRLESSAAAFLSSIDGQLRFHGDFLDTLSRGRLLTPRARRVGHDGDPLQLGLDAVLHVPLPRQLDRNLLEQGVREDLERLERLRAAAAPLADDDPKLAALQSLLEPLHGEKVVVFTEYRDTARALWRALRGRAGGVALVDGGGARLGLGRCGRREAVERFAPRANGVAPPPERERVDLLIATDVLAEGLNLQDAAHVVSYDLPWNPVRLIQRVGRIDRLGSAHAVIHSYHVLPDPTVDRLLRVTGRLRRKIAGIHATVGAEQPILDPDDAAPARYRDVAERLASGDASLLDELERAEAAPFELEERLRLALGRRLDATEPQLDATNRQLDATDPQLDATDPQRRAAGPDSGAPDRRSAAERAPRMAVLAPPAAEPTVRPGTTLVASRFGLRTLWLLVDAQGRVDEDDGVAAALLLAALKDVGVPSRQVRTEAVTRAAEQARAFVAAALTADGTAPRAVSRIQAAAADRLLRALHAEPGGPASTLCTRADRVLAALRRSGGIGADFAVRQVLIRDAAADAASLLDSLETALLRSRPADGMESGNAPAIEVLAALSVALPDG